MDLGLLVSIRVNLHSWSAYCTGQSVFERVRVGFVRVWARFECALGMLWWASVVARVGLEQG